MKNVPNLSVIEEAMDARRRLQWMQAAVLFTEAADTETSPAGVLALRRDAYLCLNRTVRFINYRTEARKANPRSDFMGEWKLPSGDLVKKLAAAPAVEWNRRRAA